MCKRTASAMLVCAASIAMPCFSQTQVEFNTTTTATSLASARNLYSIDVNNDGKPDLIRTSGGLPNVLTVFLSNGDGTFKSSYSYQFAIGACHMVRRGRRNPALRTFFISAPLSVPHRTPASDCPHGQTVAGTTFSLEPASYSATKFCR